MEEHREIRPCVRREREGKDCLGKHLPRLSRARTVLGWNKKYRNVCMKLPGARRPSELQSSSVSLGTHRLAPALVSGAEPSCPGSQQHCYELLFGAKPPSRVPRRLSNIASHLELAVQEEESTKQRTERPLPPPRIPPAEVTGDQRLTRAGAGRGAPKQQEQTLCVPCGRHRAQVLAQINMI